VTAGLLLAATVVAATPITYAYTGALNQIPVLDPDSPFPGPVDETTPFSGTFTFERNSTDGAADPQTGAYASAGSPYGFTLAIGGLTFAYSGVTVTIANNFVGLGDQYGAFFAEPSGCGKFSCAFFSLALIDPSGTALGSDALPTSAPNFASFLYSSFLYQDTIGGDQIELDGALTSLVCIAGCTVPEPSSLPLVLIAALAATFVTTAAASRRRRIRTP